MPVLVNNFTNIGLRALNSAENSTEVFVMEWFFLATERDTFSILSNVDFTVFGVSPLATT